MQFRVLSCVVIGAVALGLPGLAHHSHNAYDQSTWTTYEGRVQEVPLVNPHSWIYVEITGEDGQTAVWALESGSPTGILSGGVGREDVRPGDVIRVRCHRLRDGAPGCLLGFVTPLHGDADRGHGVEHEWG